jgi:hypothetical protein
VDVPSNNFANGVETPKAAAAPNAKGAPGQRWEWEEVFKVMLNLNNHTVAIKQAVVIWGAVWRAGTFRPKIQIPT